MTVFENFHYPELRDLGGDSLLQLGLRSVHLEVVGGRELVHAHIMFSLCL